MNKKILVIGSESDTSARITQIIEKAKTDFDMDIVVIDTEIMPGIDVKIQKPAETVMPIINAYEPVGDTVLKPSHKDRPWYARFDKRKTK